MSPLSGKHFNWMFLQPQDQLGHAQKHGFILSHPTENTKLKHPKREVVKALPAFADSIVRCRKNHNQDNRGAESPRELDLCCFSFFHAL